MEPHPGEGRGVGVADIPAPRRAPRAAAAPTHEIDPALRAAITDDEWARLEALQERIGVRFRRMALLLEAMTHASWNNERGTPSGPGHDNERLEYLGDAVLELVAGEYLFRRFSDYDEGQLTQLRASLVNTVSLARLAEGLGLGETLLLGKGAAKTGARELPSLLANSFEAMIGAVFLDQGFRVAGKVFIDNIGDLADWTDENYKGKLQEVAQVRVGTTPSYRVTQLGGPGHKRQYQAQAVVGGDTLGLGVGVTKQAAEQAAAHAALDKLAVGHADQPTGRGAKPGAGEPTRVRRRLVEAAEDKKARRPRTRTRKPAAAPPVKKPTGLIGALRAAAEALVGRRSEPEPPPEPARARRGHRGGKGRPRTPRQGGGTRS